MKALLQTAIAFLFIMGISPLLAQNLVRFEGTNHKVGFKDKNGNVVVSPKYDRVGHFNYGFAWVELNEKKGFIDKTGREITPLKYRNGDEGFSQIGIAPVAIKVNQSNEITSGLIILKWGFIDKTGKEITPFKYDDVSRTPSQEIVAVSVGCKWNNGYCKGGTWGFIDKLGNEVIPLIYDQVGALSEEEGLVLVKRNNFWGYVDKTNKEVIPLKFDEAQKFFQGKAKVRSGNRTFYIDKVGNETE